MSTQPSLKVTKSFTYRGQTTLFSNRYYFTGSDPTGSTEWTTLSDAVTASEKTVYATNVTIVETTGYNAGSDVPVFSKTYSLAGTHTMSGGSVPATGDSVLLVRYSTDQRSSKNHPIYLFNYYHGAYNAAGTSPDTPDISQRSQMGSYASGWVSGFSDGTNTRIRTGPRGAVAQGSFVETWLMHRDFPN